MSFFKKLFGSRKKDKEETKNIPRKIDGIYTEDYFDKRYVEDPLEETVLEGSLKMIKSFFIETKLNQEVKEPINHPKNLDQVVTEDIGFHMFCKGYGLEDRETIMFLAMGFSQFMIENLKFKCYLDKEPEFPLRSMTLKYNENGAMLSLYPFEYALKVLNAEATFEGIHVKVNNAIQSLPSKDEILKKLTTKPEQE